MPLNILCVPDRGRRPARFPTGNPREFLMLIPGYYGETLTAERAATFAATTKAGVVFIGCDFYESTLKVADFIRLLEREPVLCFDDSYRFNGRPDQGERSAIKEFLPHHQDRELVECVNVGQHGESFLIHLREKDSL